MSKKTYPEEIYPKLGFKTDAFGRLTQWTTCHSDFEHAYDLGFKNGKLKADLENQAPLVGCSNLTEAIKAGERIDWVLLDGVEAKCVHPELGALTHKLERDASYVIDCPQGWCKEEASSDWGRIYPVWGNALTSGWDGKEGWTLYIKGDLPLRKRTADQLEPGTCFRARYQMGVSTYTYTRAQVIQIGDKTQVACFSGSAPVVIIWRDPADIEVLEVYGVGTFGKPKEDA